MDIKHLLFVGCGSFVGGILRYSLSRMVQGWGQGTLPWGTLAVNVLGCALLGALSAMLIKHFQLSEEWRLALTVGLCGGFTTFSTFAHETMLLLHQGAWWLAILYAGASVMLCMLGMMTGYYLVIKCI